MALMSCFSMLLTLSLSYSIQSADHSDTSLELCCSGKNVDDFVRTSLFTRSLFQHPIRSPWEVAQQALL